MKLVLSAREVRRFAVFGIVGTLNTVICYALFALLVEVCAWHYHLALTVDYAFGIVVGFLLHRTSTFADRRHLRQAFSKYTLTLVATFLANLALLDALVRGRLAEPLLAQAVAMTIVALASYGVQTRWVFRHHVRTETRPENDRCLPTDDRAPSRRRAA